MKYDRDVLKQVVIYHYKSSIEGCRCGYTKLGACNSDHVADEYEKAMRAKQERSSVDVNEGMRCYRTVGTHVYTVKDGIRFDPPLRLPATCGLTYGHDGHCIP